MTSKLDRPDIFVPLSVRFISGKTGTKLLQTFGRDGPLVWASYLCACRLNHPQGEISYTSEAQAWQLLNLQGYEPDFGIEDFFKITGQLKQTRRTTSGRTTYVTSTQWERWNNVNERDQARRRKARSRAQSDRDTVTNESQTESDSAVTRARVEGEGEGEGESTSPKGVTPTSTPHAPRSGQNGLPFAQELILQNILTAIGADADNGTPQVLRRYAVHLPEAALAKILESVTGTPKRDKASYAVAALKSECQERGIQVK